ncbi:MAG: PAS domain S-box protein [Planctomycetota bacterium]
MTADGQATADEYRALLSEAPCALLVVQDDRVVFATDAMERLALAPAGAPLAGRAAGSLFPDGPPGEGPATLQLPDRRLALRGAPCVWGGRPALRLVVDASAGVEALTRELRWWEAVLDSLHVGFGLVRASDGTFIYANPRLHALFGYAPGDLVGTAAEVLNAGAPEGATRRAEEIRRAIVNEGEWRGELLNRRKDGSTLWTYASVSLFDHPDHGPVGVGIQEDVTPLKESQQAVEALHVALARQLAAVAESEERLRLVEQGVNDGVWDWNISAQQTYRSPRWLEILGYGPDELSADESTYLERIHPDDRARRDEALRAHLERGERFSLELRLRHREGAYRWVLMRGEAQRDPAGEPVRMVGSISDITQRRAAEDELRQSQELLDRIFNGTSEMLALAQVEPDGDLTCLAVNSSYLGMLEDLFGPGTPSPVGQSRRRFLGSLGFPREHIEAEQERYRRALEVGEAESFLSRIPAPQGPREFEVCIEPFPPSPGERRLVLWSARDVTARAAAERDLSSERELSAAVLDHVGALVVVLDAEGRIRRFNRAAEDLCGRSFAELEGHTLWETVVAPDQALSVRDRALRCLQRDAECGRSTHEWLTAAGERRAIDWANTLLLDPGGTTRFMVCLGMDITERRRIEEALGRSLAEKETLLREVHHRVKNNLQIIASLLYFQADRAQDPRAAEVLAESRDRLRSMVLVHEHLYRTADLARVDLGEFLRELGSQLARGRPGAPLELQLELEDGVELSVETALPVGLIVCELLMNVAKYAYPAGTPGRVTVGLARGAAAGTVVATVADEGVGMPAGFDPGRAESFGWQLIERLAGQLRGQAQLEPGPGTRVTLSFPAS